MLCAHKARQVLIRLTMMKHASKQAMAGYAAANMFNWFPTK